MILFPKSVLLFPILVPFPLLVLLPTALFPSHHLGKSFKDQHECMSCSVKFLKPLTPKYIQLITQYYVSPRFIEHPSTMILGIWYYPNVFPSVSSLVRHARLHLLHLSIAAMTRSSKGLSGPHCLPYFIS